MDIAGISEKARSAGRTDEEIVERVKSGDTALYEVVMRRYNQRLDRIARDLARRGRSRRRNAGCLRPCL